MPSASANISAKFIAQIEISKPCVSSASSPAEATRPRIVSISGSPAATSEPKASTRMTSVTGQEKSSDFIIAVRLARVEVAPHPGGAGQRDADAVACRARCSLPFSVSAAATIAVGSPFAPAVTIAVCRSAEMRRARPRRRHGSDVRVRPQGPLDARDGRSEARVARRSGSASARRPSAPSWRGRRSWPGSASCACTDSEPFACQPAPESAVSTFGAKKPSPTAITIHAIATARPWSAVQRPSRPTGPTVSGCSRALGQRSRRRHSAHSRRRHSTPPGA